MEHLHADYSGEALTTLICTVAGLVIRWVEKRKLKKRLKKEQDENK